MSHPDALRLLGAGRGPPSYGPTGRTLVRSARCGDLLREDTELLPHPQDSGCPSPGGEVTEGHGQEAARGCGEVRGFRAPPAPPASTVLENRAHWGCWAGWQLPHSYLSAWALGALRCQQLPAGHRAASPGWAGSPSRGFGTWPRLLPWGEGEAHALCWGVASVAAPALRHGRERPGRALGWGWGAAPRGPFEETTPIPAPPKPQRASGDLWLQLG